jgi:predicted alpha/beta superfamily hydrolase
MKTKKSMNVKMKLLLIASAAIFLTGLTLNLKAGDNKISIGEKVTIQSKVLNEERNLLVYLPDGYNLITTSEYPVIYLLDGGYHFLHASGIVQFLSGQGIMPPAIVVGIVNVDRGRDFTPTPDPKKQKGGGADKFMSFIQDEMMHYINKTYRTQPYNILVGHSLGGTFATYAFLNNPDLFDGYISISPYLGWDDNMLVKQTKEKLKTGYKNKFFYMTLGNEPEYTASVEKFAQIIQTAAPDGLTLKYEYMKDEDHGSIPHLSMYHGFEAIYEGWKMPDGKYKEGLASIDAHYKSLSDKFGYEIKTPEYIINLLGYQYLGNKEFDKAIGVFKENVKRFPGSANVYDSLGEAQEKNNQLAEAEKNYEKAVALSEKNSNEFTEVYKGNLKRIQKTLAEK